MPATTPQEARNQMPGKLGALATHILVAVSDATQTRKVERAGVVATQYRDDAQVLRGLASVLDGAAAIVENGAGL